MLAGRIWLAFDPGARKNTHKRKKTMSLRDFRKDDQNEYYAGGLDENGGGSATCLIYPGEALCRHVKP